MKRLKQIGLWTGIITILAYLLKKNEAKKLLQEFDRQKGEVERFLSKEYREPFTIIKASGLRQPVTTFTALSDKGLMVKVEKQNNKLKIKEEHR